MRNARTIGLLAAAFSGLTASAAAQVTIDFDGLPSGTPVTTQYPEATFSSTAGNQNVTLFAGTGNVLCTGPVGGSVTCIENTYIDFTYPANGLTLVAVEPNDPGVVARFQIYENGLFTAVEDLIGLGGPGKKTVDLSAYQNVTRLEMVNILNVPGENGVAWDEIGFVEQTAPYNYCTGKLNTAGCTPTLSWTGTPSKSAGSGFVITASDLIDNSVGILIYSKVSANQLPFMGGLLCVKPTVWRTSVQNSGGAGACGGSLSLDFNLWIAIGPDKFIFEGTQIWSQCWSRDVADPTGTSLSDALSFVVGP